MFQFHYHYYEYFDIIIINIINVLSITISLLSLLFHIFISRWRLNVVLNTCYYYRCSECSGISKFCTWCPLEGQCSTQNSAVCVEYKVEVSIHSILYFPLIIKNIILPHFTIFKHH